VPTDPFVAYYEQQSASSETVEHFDRLRALLLKVHPSSSPDGLRIADIGCGAGTFSRMWAEAGCIVKGLDVNAELIGIARARSRELGSRVTFEVGSAESLPWNSGEFDIVVMPEILEHVPDWEACLEEATRVLAGGGVLYLSTSNRLCPIQHEFELPLYSWYPRSLKRHCVKLARSSRKAWVNHAEYPAVNWFDAFQLGRILRSFGLTALDRFDLLARYSDDALRRRLARIITSTPPSRFLGHVASPGLFLVALRQ
jgi:2-polyprenyl-3-methyl-5-hydroxy-6-metoxy-1,4-benzoquinol methylase